MHPYFIVIKLIGDFENDVLNDIGIKNHNVGIIRSKNYKKNRAQRKSIIILIIELSIQISLEFSHRAWMTTLFQND